MRKTDLNKYLAFDKSIHQTMAEYNLTCSTLHNSTKEILEMLNSSWISDGYSSAEEEYEFKMRARNMLRSYIYTPHDKGVENLIVDKFLTHNLNKKVMLGSKVDKVYERLDGNLEVIDYKSGYIVRHNNGFPIKLKPSLLILLVYYKLGVYPRFISYYYLSYNMKFTRFITKNEIDQAYRVVNAVLMG